MRRPPSPVRADERGVSTTVGYVLTLAITATLISGLLIAGGAYVEDQRDAVARDELEVLGDQLASGFVDADRLAGSSDGGDLRVRVWLPTKVVDASYTISVTNVASPSSGPWRSVLTMRSDATDLVANVTVLTTFQPAERTVKGGPVTIVHRDVDSDGKRELVINRTTLTVAQPRPADLGHSEIVYVKQSTGELSSVSPSGVITRYGVTDVGAIGPKEIDFDGDGLREVPYVTSAGEVRLVDEAGERQTLATGAKATKTLLGVGKWNGEFQVFYVNTSDGDTIYHVGLDGTPTKVVTAADGAPQAHAVAGVVDFNNDGDVDIVYSGTSSQIRYVDNGEILGASLDTVGSNFIDGVGQPRLLAPGDSVPWMPGVDGSNEINVYDYRDNSPIWTTGSGDKSKKSTVALIDWTGGDQKEVVYIHYSEDDLYYVQSDGTWNPILVGGNRITPDPDVGVA